MLGAIDSVDSGEVVGGEEAVTRRSERQEVIGGNLRGADTGDR
jgi:hypothetical protein